MFYNFHKKIQKIEILLRWRAFDKTTNNKKQKTTEKKKQKTKNNKQQKTTNNRQQKTTNIK